MATLILVKCEMTAPTDPARSIPILASLNIDETRDFFVDQLGFSIVYNDPASYLIVRRDEMEIHYWKTNNQQFSENTSCYIRGGQVVELYAEFQNRRVDRLSDFTVRPWNMKEFYIHDPHGNLLKFGCAPEEI